MSKYMRFGVASKGDNSTSEWEGLFKLLEEGWEIVSGVADGYLIYYILKKEQL